MTVPSVNPPPTICQAPFPDPIPGPIPHGSLFVVSGASGAGKTILAAQMMQAIREGKPFCGYPTNPQTGYGLIAADRDWSTYRTIYERVGFPEIPRYVLANDKEFDPRDWGKRSNALTLFERCLYLLNPVPGSLVYVDPAAPLFVQGNQNEARDVALSLHWYRRLGDRFRITLGIFANVAKQKIDDMYKRAQDRIAGSGAWVAYSDTQISVEQDDGIVTMRWYPRLGTQTEHQFKFNPETGLFAPHESVEEPNQQIGTLSLPGHLARIYLLIPADGTTTTSPEVVRAAEKQYQLKRAVVFKHLQKLIELGTILRDELGVICRAKPPSIN